MRNFWETLLPDTRRPRLFIVCTFSVSVSNRYEQIASLQHRLQDLETELAVALQEKRRLSGLNTDVGMLVVL
jgi:hypothetical protein